MDKGEPSLVPEWLRTSGHSSSGGNSNHLLVSSSSHSDSSASLLRNSRNCNSRNKSVVDLIHSPFLDRSSSTNSRRGSSNGSAKHAYSSFNFNRNQRDKDRNREKERVSNVDPWDFYPSFPPRDQDPLRRSRSMVTRNQGDHLSRGLRNGENSNSYNGNVILPGPSNGNSFQRTGFDKDFPSLGAEEKHGGNDVARVSSPVLSSAVQSLPVGSSALIGGEGWTSALAEVPNVIDKSCAGSTTFPLASVVSTGTVNGSTTSPLANVVSTGTVNGPAGLNMAEALVQAPARTHPTPQGAVKTQRLEDLAIKQSRQLIPVVPSTTKCSSLNPLDKSKIKQVVRIGETCLAPSRNAQQQPTVLFGNSQSNPNGLIKTEKKLLILKPTRENGVATVKESGSPTNSRATSSQLTTQSTQSVPVGSSNTPKELKRATNSSIIEKKSKSQSRNAFFSALKQKTTSTNISSDPADSSSIEGKIESSKELVANESSSPQAIRTSQLTTCCFEETNIPDEKEVEFLRSLGWVENNGEDEGLTEEEINAFFEQNKNLRPSLPQKLSIIQEEAKEDATQDS